jgi:isopentenyldiphosphate isomerase
MDNRMLEIVDEEGKVTGIETREKIHQEGLLHRIVHVWFYTPDKKLIFQRRGKSAETFPNLLDATVGGHVEIGSDYIKTAITETEEETGIVVKAEEFTLLDTRKPAHPFRDPVTGTLNNHLKAIYAFPFKGNLKDIKAGEGEDVTIKFEEYPLDKILSLSKEEWLKNFIPSQREPEYFDIFQKIKGLMVASFYDERTF